MKSLLPVFEFTKDWMLSALETPTHERKSTQSHRMISYDPVVIIGNVLLYFTFIVNIGK